MLPGTISYLVGGDSWRLLINNYLLLLLGEGLDLGAIRKLERVEIHLLLVSVMPFYNYGLLRILLTSPFTLRT